MLVGALALSVATEVAAAICQYYLPALPVLAVCFAVLNQAGRWAEDALGVRKRVARAVLTIYLLAQVSISAQFAAAHHQAVATRYEAAAWVVWAAMVVLLVLQAFTLWDTRKLPE